MALRCKECIHVLSYIINNSWIKSCFLARLEVARKYLDKELNCMQLANLPCTVVTRSSLNYTSYSINMKMCGTYILKLDDPTDTTHVYICFIPLIETFHIIVSYFISVHIMQGSHNLIPISLQISEQVCNIPHHFD